ncbi:ABC transporter substrate-binding protein [Arthrobacter ramosus]|uniref:ABC transporter substrate-binding protein n=1 Tax=Arthrobacter ramosus TaxID=1672 RepID=A0ABV5XWR6_ARTRM|nr:sugar ABC transporter substrate-binding protein [Arthrobacter ramosus]
MHSFTRRRALVVAAVGVAALVGTTGCSPTAGSGSTGSGGTVNLSLQIWNPTDKPGVQKAIDGFQAANPTIHVTLEQVPEDQYYTKLDASLGAGSGPDVMWQSSKAPYYVKGGALQPLDEYIKRDNLTLKDLYPQQITNLYNFDGKQYGIPKDQDVWMWVYNTAVFKKLGVTDVPTANWTWDDMVRIAGELKAKTSAPSMYYGYVLNGPVSSIIRSLGGTVVQDSKGTVNSPQGIEAFKKVKDLQDQGLIPAVKDSGDFNAPTSLIAGNIGMSRIPSYLLSLLSKANVPAGTFVAVPTPSINGSHASDTNGLSYVMNANSSHKDEAWKLIKYLTSDEGAKLHAEGGAAQPANLSSDVKAAYFKANSSIAGLQETFNKMLPDQYLRTTTEFPATRAVFAELESTATAPFFAGSLTAEQAAQKADGLLTKSFLSK